MKTPTIQQNSNPTKQGQIRPIDCDSCGASRFTELYQKRSRLDQVFKIQSCKNCGLVQVNPQPDVEAVRPYYSNIYFSARTERGYDNYYSDAVKRQINSTYDLNLKDLGFYDYERTLEQKCSLDIGCAAGYFVEFMRGRGWRAQGVEISEDAAQFGLEQLGLDILVDDFLSCKSLKPNSYDMVSLWASIEHMHSPRRVLERCAQLLKPGGRMLLSTCRYGLLARITGLNWRYLNVPEHLYYFTLKGLKNAAQNAGLRTVRAVSYGSGFTTRKDGGFLYNTAKKIADPLVKTFNQGDMMALMLEKS